MANSDKAVDCRQRPRGVRHCTGQEPGCRHYATAARARTRTTDTTDGFTNCQYHDKRSMPHRQTESIVTTPHWPQQGVYACRAACMSWYVRWCVPSHGRHVTVTAWDYQGCRHQQMASQVCGGGGAACVGLFSLIIAYGLSLRSLHTGIIVISRHT